MPDYFSPYGRSLTSSYPTRVISGTDILELGSEQQQMLIGHTLTYCNELEAALNEAVSKAEEYHALGVENGYIIPVKSQEELAQEQITAQNEINAKLLETVQALTEKIERLEVSNNESDADSIASSTGVLAQTGGKSRKRTKEVSGE